MLRNLRNTRRLFEIALTLAREDALFLLEDYNLSPTLLFVCRCFARRNTAKRKGERLAAALERLGPTFVKFGQALSTRSDLIGDALADDLSSLRDRLPPFPSDVARHIIEDEFKQPLSALYKEFSDAPVAAASIAQVHKAVTAEGKTVAVKILRPGIEQAFARDLDVFLWIAEQIESRVKSARRLKARQVVETFKESVFFELDLRFEAAAADELAANVAKHEPGFRVPRMDWNRTTRRVLTAEWIDGIPIDQVDAIRAQGHNPDVILGKAARSLFAQVFIDGFFHADLHPGNLFVDAKGDIVAVDFGIMGRLDWASRVYMAEILRGFLNEDYRHVAEMHFAAGYVPAGKSLEAFTQACMAVARPIMGKPLNEISVAALLGQMFHIASEFEMETQPQLLLLQKTMMVTEGVGRMLNPSLNMWELARPMIEQWARDNFGFTARAKSGIKDGIALARKFPHVMGYVENALKTLGSGEGLRLHPDTLFAMERDRRRRQQPWLRLAWTALAVAIIWALCQGLR